LSDGETCSRLWNRYHLSELNRLLELVSARRARGVRGGVTDSGAAATAGSSYDMDPPVSAAPKWGMSRCRR